MSEDDKTKKDGCGMLLLKYFLRFLLVAFIGFIALLCISLCSVFKGGARDADGKAKDPFNRFLDLQERSLDLSEETLKDMDKEVDNLDKAIEEADKKAEKEERKMEDEREDWGVIPGGKGARLSLHHSCGHYALCSPHQHSHGRFSQRVS